MSAGVQITPDHLLPCLLRHLLQVLLLLSMCAAGAFFGSELQTAVLTTHDGPSLLNATVYRVSASE